MVSHIKLAVIDEPELWPDGEFAPNKGWKQAVSTVASTFCANGVRTVIISAQYSGLEPTCYSDLDVIGVILRPTNCRFFNTGVQKAYLTKLRV